MFLKAFFKWWFQDLLFLIFDLFLNLRFLFFLVFKYVFFLFFSWFLLLFYFLIFILMFVQLFFDISGEFLRIFKFLFCKDSNWPDKIAQATISA